MEILKIKFENKLTFYIPPFLCLVLAFSLPLLHFTSSRVYNFRVAILQLLIIIIAFVIYKKELFTHFIKLNADKIIILIFFLSGLVSCLNSEFIRHSFTRYYSVMIWFSYFWLLVFLLRKRYLSASFIIFVITTSTLIPILHYSYIYFISDGTVSVWDITANTHYYSHIRHFGYHLIIAAILSFYYLFIPPVKYYLNYFFGIFLITINAVALFWSEGRQGAIIFVIFSFLFILKLLRANSLKAIVITVMLALLSLVSLFMFFNETAVFKRLIETLNATDNMTAFLSGRNNIWNDSLDLLKDNWFFGIGPDSFFNISRSKSYAVQPHSVLFQFLLSWGLIGLVILIVIFERLISKGICNYIHVKSQSQKPIIFIALSGMVAVLIHSIMDGVFYHVLPLTIFILLSSIVLSDNAT